MNGKLQVQLAADEFRVEQLLGALLRHWKMLGMASALGLGLGIAIIAFTTSMYRADVLLAPSSTGGVSGLGDFAKGLGNLAGAFSANLGMDADVLEQNLALIRSRAFTVNFAHSKNLMPEMFPERWDSKKGEWRVKEGANELDVPTDEQVYRTFNGRRNIVVGRGESTVTIRIEWTDPQMAAKIANDMVDEANRYARMRVAEESARSIKYLDQQLKTAQAVEIRSMLYGLYEEQTKRAMYAEVKDDFMFRVIDPAISPERQIRPRPLLYSVSGLLGGFLVGFMALVVRFRLRRTI